MSGVREPRVVVNARAEVQRAQWWMRLAILWMAVGWVPLVPLDLYAVQATVTTPVLVLYLLGALVGTGVLAWKGQQTQWARELIASWQRAQADGTVRQAMHEEGLSADAISAAVVMERIREHLQVETRALQAAEDAYARLRVLVREEESAREALTGLSPGEGHDQLRAAAERLSEEARNIEGSLAALYATLLTRDSGPTFSGLKETMFELEAEVEVAQTLAREDGAARPRPPAQKQHT